MRDEQYQPEQCQTKTKTVVRTNERGDESVVEGYLWKRTREDEVTRNGKGRVGRTRRNERDRDR